MKVRFKIYVILLVAATINLGSCVNQVKDTPKTQVQDTTKGKDTLSRLAFFYNIPDSNNILSVKFQASLTPSLQKDFRLDWDFDDTSGIISSFDTNSLIHIFKNFGSYIVSLSVIDTQTNILVRKVSDTLLIMINAGDTNYLHGFTKLSMIFSGVRQYDTGQAIVNITLTRFQQGSHDSLPNIHWIAEAFTLNGQSGWSYIDNSGNNYFFEAISIAGKISSSGNTIESGSYSFDHSEQHAWPGHPWAESKGDSLRIQSLPCIKKDYDSIIYYSSGPQLKNMMTSYLEYDSGMTSITNPPKNYYDIVSRILWDKQPSLTVTFSK